MIFLFLHDYTNAWIVDHVLPINSRSIAFSAQHTDDIRELSPSTFVYTTGGPAIEQASKTRQNRPERVQICVFISIYVCHAQFFVIYPRIFTFVLFCYCCCFCWSRLFDPTDRWMLWMWWLSSLAYRLYVKKYTENHSISKKLEKREWKLSKSNYKLRKNVPLISTFRISRISSKKTASTHIVSYA